jgi:hypothetical protein
MLPSVRCPMVDFERMTGNPEVIGWIFNEESAKSCEAGFQEDHSGDHTPEKSPPLGNYLCPLANPRQFGKRPQHLTCARLRFSSALRARAPASSARPSDPSVIPRSAATRDLLFAPPFCARLSHDAL